MSKVLEVYRILKDKLGEEEARVVAEAFDEFGGTRENLATKDDIETLNQRIQHLRTEVKQDIENLNQRIENLRTEVKQDLEKLRREFKEDITRIDDRFTRLESRLWWIVGIILVQWLSLMIATIFK